MIATVIGRLWRDVEHAQHYDALVKRIRMKRPGQLLTPIKAPGRVLRTIRHWLS